MTGSLRLASGVMASAGEEVVDLFVNVLRRGGSHPQYTSNWLFGVVASTSTWLRRRTLSEARSLTVCTRISLGKIAGLSLTIKHIGTSLIELELPGCMPSVQFSMFDAQPVRGLELLWVGLDAASQLRVLDLSANHLLPEDIPSLADALESLPLLEVLILADNQLLHQTRGGALAATSPSVLRFQQAVGGLSRLQRLDLDSNCLSAPQIATLSSAFGGLANLGELSLSGNYAMGEGMEALACALPRLGLLGLLDLSGNSIGLDGAVALRQALPHLCQLQVLQLRGNMLGPNGVCAMADGLQCLHHLVVLDLSYNRIGLLGATAISSVLSELHVLEAIDVSGNDLRAAGAVELTEGLTGASSLTELNISGNALGKLGACAVIQKLPLMERMKTVDISYNGLDDNHAGHVLCIARLLASQIEVLI